MCLKILAGAHMQVSSPFEAFCLASQSTAALLCQDPKSHWGIVTHFMG